MDDEVMGSYGEIAGLDVNAKLFAQLPGGRSALRRFLIVRTPWSVKLQSSMYADMAVLP